MSRPVLVGVGVVQQRCEDPTAAKEPVELMVDAALAAAEDSGVRALAQQIGRVYVPKGRWRYADPARLVANELGATRATSVLARIGILQQTVVGAACTDIVSGDADAVMVVGGEAGYRTLRSSITGATIQNRPDSGPPDVVMSPPAEMITDEERDAGLGGAVGFYAIIESAYRAAHGLTISERREQVARVYSRFSDVAAGNPHAWKRERLSVEDIRDESGRNRMLAFPYSRLLVSSFNVDQACALLFCSEEKALASGIPREKWIYPTASTECKLTVPVSARPEVGTAPGTAAAGRAALDSAGVSISDVELFDLYSCFPVAVDTFAEALGGIPEGHDLTVTGGMPSAGGPLNNYNLMAHCRMAELLRERPGASGLVTCVSGLLTKQGFAIWSTEPGPSDFAVVDVTSEAAKSLTLKRVVKDYAGPGTIAGYTVLYEGNQAVRGVAVVDTGDGRRSVGATTDSDDISGLLTREMVGQQVTMATGAFRLVADAARTGGAS